jgi:curved DNA-binding protein CbpA
MTAAECLGVSPEATKSEIRKAYHKKSLEWHPDKWAGSSLEIRYQVDHIYSLIGRAYRELVAAVSTASTSGDAS